MKTNEKTFIAITSEVYQEKTVHLCTSQGESITNEAGIDCKTALDFLFNLVHKRKRTGGIVFVTYAFARDNEFIFSTLPKELRDKLFVSYKIKKEINELEFEIEGIQEDYYKYAIDSDEFQLADFELHVNTVALQELQTIEYEGYHLELANGKLLTIKKNKKSITIYDIFGFFKPQSLRLAVHDFLGEVQPLLDRQSFDALDFFDGESDLDKLKAHASFEVGYIQRLATALHEKFVEQDINLSRWHGASSLASYVLSKAEARKQFHNYRYRRQLAPELHLALRQSLYGGRAEQFKIGTLYDVNVYDINSAYAYAVTQLPMMLNKPVLTQEWQPTQFSFWHCEYDFTSVNPYFGYLPNREMSSFTKYKLRGEGYFWQPEIMFVMEHFPQCVKIGRGYILEAEKAPFTEAIENLYNLRLYLQEQKEPLEKVLKLALSSIYGKFCQHNGKGYYYNLFYAAYITSVARAQLLHATQGNETGTICFQTDAIHTVRHLPVNLDNRLGNFKHTNYHKVTYLDNGVYQCYDREGKVCKTKTRGFRRFNFPQALKELHEKRTYTAIAEFFMGHNLFSQNMFTSVKYLEDFAEPKTMKPAEKDRFAMRHFIGGDIDLARHYMDSKPVATYNGLASSPYQIGKNTDINSCIDTIQAGRI